jgi:hypothetical protein
MGVCYDLVNQTKRERITFIHLPANKASELTLHAATAGIVTWYMLHNLGDQISFVSDSHDEWPFPEGSRDDMYTYPDMTEIIVDRLIREGILIDEGKDVFFDDEPDIYIRRLRLNGWTWSLE